MAAREVAIISQLLHFPSCMLPRFSWGRKTNTVPVLASELRTGMIENHHMSSPEGLIVTDKGSTRETEYGETTPSFQQCCPDLVLDEDRT